MYACMYIGTYTNIHIHIRDYNVRMLLYIYIYTDIYEYMKHTYVELFFSLSLSLSVSLAMYIYICANIYTHIYVHRLPTVPKTVWSSTMQIPQDMIQTFPCKPFQSFPTTVYKVYSTLLKCTPIL